MERHSYSTNDDVFDGVFHVAPPEMDPYVATLLGGIDEIDAAPGLSVVRDVDADASVMAPFDRWSF